VCERERERERERAMWRAAFWTTSIILRCVCVRKRERARARENVRVCLCAGVCVRERGQHGERHFGQPVSS